MPVPTTALYAALLGLFYAVLAMRVVRLRLQLKIRVGDGGDPRLQRAVRVHGHFAEYVPLLLLMLLLLEMNGTPAAGLHAFGVLLILSRVLHAVGVSAEPENLRWRLAGMVCTFTALTGAVAGLLLAWLRQA